MLTNLCIELCYLNIYQCKNNYFKFKFKDPTVTANLNLSISGKRDCLGKSLALTEMYLFFSALMQKYSFRWISEDRLEELSTKTKIGFIQTPPAYQVIVKKRN